MDSKIGLNRVKSGWFLRGFGVADKVWMAISQKSGLAASRFCLTAWLRNVHYCTVYTTMYTTELLCPVKVKPQSSGKKIQLSGTMTL